MGRPNLVQNPSIPVLYVCKPAHWDLMGCLLVALTFWLFYKTFDIGKPAGQYKAPYYNCVPVHVFDWGGTL